MTCVSQALPETAHMKPLFREPHGAPWADLENGISKMFGSVFRQGRTEIPGLSKGNFPSGPVDQPVGAPETMLSEGANLPKSKKSKTDYPGVATVRVRRETSIRINMDAANNVVNMFFQFLLFFIGINYSLNSLIKTPPAVVPWPLCSSPKRRYRDKIAPRLFRIIRLSAVLFGHSVRQHPNK